MDYNINKNIQVHYPRQQSLNNKATFANIFEDVSGQKKRYFSGIDAEIYFDDIYIDDVVRIDFGVEQLGSAIYGYELETPPVVTVIVPKLKIRPKILCFI